MYTVLMYYVLLPVLIVAVSILVIFSPKIYRYAMNKLTTDESPSRSILPGQRGSKYKGKESGSKISFESFGEIIDTAGYAYNPGKDVFFSTMEAWQRRMGYCRLYDEAAAPLGMIIDSEPIYFNYGGKRWLIEFWKGQYDLTTGCEVGIYNTNWPDLNIPGFFNGTFYHCASDRDRMYMSFYLKKNGETIITRSDKHWWLTGFKLGEFSEPWELVLDIYITFKNRRMRDAFLESLQKTGYTDEEYETRGTTVALRFDKPHSRQPRTRRPDTDFLIQRKNQLLCNSYNTLTNGYTNIVDKVNAVKNNDPELYKELFNIGKTMAVFNVFDKIKDYLNVDTYNTP